jgi:hypothetical protein
MNQKLRSFLSILVSLIFLSGCVTDPELSDSQLIVGYRPVYGKAEDSQILFTQSRAVENPGKIYVYGKYLLVNERKKGIHVFDNTHPATPTGIGFIQLLGNTDMAIKDGTLYADHLGNLVSLTLQDFTAIQELGRLPIRNWYLGVPPPARFHFECVDPDKGLVIAWTKSELNNPQCYAIR